MTVPQPIDEAHLVQRARGGDAHAERLLFDTHVGRVHALAFRMCGSADMADDLTQVTFIRAFAQLPAYRRDAPFGAWLHRIAVSVILNGLRSQRRRGARELPLELGGNVSFQPMERDPSLSRALERSMEELSPESRVIVILHEIEGYSLTEIARITGALPGTVRVRLARAKSRLRKILQPYREASLE